MPTRWKPDPGPVDLANKALRVDLYGGATFSPETGEIKTCDVMDVYLLDFDGGPRPKTTPLLKGLIGASQSEHLRMLADTIEGKSEICYPEPSHAH